MSLIQGTSKEQAKMRYKQRMITTINTIFKTLVEAIQAGQVATWQNTDGLTPQECFDALGKDAAELEQIKTALANALNGLSPNSIDIKTPKPVTVNEDGTVKVG